MYIKYHNFRNILTLQNNIMKKEDNSVTELIDDKLKVIVNLQKTSDKVVVIQSVIKNKRELLTEETQTQNQNNQKCNLASSNENTKNQKSALDLKNSKHDQNLLVETTNFKLSSH